MNLRIAGPALLLAALGATACFEPKIEASRSTTNPIVARPPKCKFETVTNLPSAKFEELGYLRSTGKVMVDREEFKRSIAEDVCRLGGELALLESDAYGAIAGATVYRHAELDAGVAVAVVEDAGPPPPAAPTHEWVAFENKKIGVAFRYPNDVFKLKEKPNAIEIDSGISVDGLGHTPPPKKEVKPSFKGKFEVRAKSASACIKDDAPLAFKTAFKNGEFVEGQGVEKKTVGDKAAYLVPENPRGTSVRRYYVAFTDKKTAVFQIELVGNLTPAKPGFSGDDQIAMADEIAQSIAPPPPAPPKK